MPNPNPLERISMTIPADALRRADRLAREWDRSRSWVLAEGIRQLEAPTDEGEEPQRLDASRLRQLRDDLRLAPLERVIAAERTAREVPVRSFGRLFVSFDRPEDYVEWQRLESTARL